MFAEKYIPLFYALLWGIYLPFALWFSDSWRIVLDFLAIILISLLLHIHLRRLANSKSPENQAQNEYFQDLLKSMDDVIFTLDTAQKHTGIYGNWLVRNNLSASTFLQKTSREIFGAEAAKIHEDANNRALQGENIVYEWQVLSNESVKSYQTRISPIRDKSNNKVIGLVGIGRDITQQEEMERKLEAYQQSLEELVAQRTQELIQANERLQAEIIKREKAHSEAVYQANLAESLRDVSWLLNNSIEIDSIFQPLSSIIGRLIAHDCLSFMLFEDDNFARIYTFPEIAQKQSKLIAIHNNVHIDSILETKAVLRLNNTSNIAPSPIHNTIQSALSAPICYEGKVLGFIHLGRNSQIAFEQKDEVVIESFANQIAIAVHNFQMVQKAQEVAIIQERGRIARDLHDAVTQTLFSANLLAETLLNVSANEYAESQDILKQLRHLTQGALAEMRALLFELRPQFFENTTLQNLVKQLADAFYSRTQIPVEIISNTPFLLTAMQREILYRIVQEALNNSAKHSRAKNVKIQIHWNYPHFQMSIEDNGIGFKQNNKSGLGLAIMRERAEQIGANLQIESTAAGTKISLDWSVKDE